ncbi:MAG: alkaline phosphatase family protein, partial [Proteobacteria bacterium]|nr:alkaline phosphatase family protein [Pseudomonadota bacterium]
VSTGCQPARHGLHGNRMGLMEDGKVVVRDVGDPAFRDHMRRATGRTLHVPALAERVAGAGGCIVFSNVSPGAAYFLDPDCHGYVYHRAGSFAPGGAKIEGPDALSVSHDGAGDWSMTQRFCTEVLEQRRPAVALLWLSDPDLTMHRVPLGSPEHAAALAGAERCVAEVVATVDRLRAAGEDILLMIGSDHGQETIGESVDMDAWLNEHGLGAALAAGDVAVAGQGTAAVLYATERGRAGLLGVLDAMRRMPWAAEVLTEEKDLAAHGFAARQGIVAAVDMARRAEPNPFGVPGKRYVVIEPGKGPAIGCGQHGGWGPDETRPFLMLDDAGRSKGAVDRATSLADIAPTIVHHLGLPLDGFDGRPLR